MRLAALALTLSGVASLSSRGTEPTAAPATTGENLVGTFVFKVTYFNQGRDTI